MLKVWQSVGLCGWGSRVTRRFILRPAETYCLIVCTMALSSTELSRRSRTPKKSSGRKLKKSRGGGGEERCILCHGHGWFWFYGRRKPERCARCHGTGLEPSAGQK